MLLQNFLEMKLEKNEKTLHLCELGTIDRQINHNPPVWNLHHANSLTGNASISVKQIA